MYKLELKKWPRKCWVFEELIKHYTLKDSLLSEITGLRGQKIKSREGRDFTYNSRKKC